MQPDSPSLMIAVPAAAAATRSLAIPDLTRLARALRLPNQPTAIFEAVHAIALETIGFKLFTIMCFDAAHFEVERVFTNMPDAYPISGRKKKRGSAWGEHTLQKMMPFRASGTAQIRDAFDDHAILTGMGLGSILNIPVAYDGKCVGTMNLTHVEGWYRHEHEELGVLLASFLAAPLALHQMRRTAD